MPREVGCVLPIEQGVQKGPSDGVQMPAGGRLLTRIAPPRPRLSLPGPCVTCSFGRHGRSCGVGGRRKDGEGRMGGLGVVCGREGREVGRKFFGRSFLKTGTLRKEVLVMH